MAAGARRENGAPPGEAPRFDSLAGGLAAAAAAAGDLAAGQRAGGAADDDSDRPVGAAAAHPAARIAPGLAVIIAVMVGERRRGRKDRHDRDRHGGGGEGEGEFTHDLGSFPRENSAYER